MTNLTMTEIAKLTAAAEGNGGFKRSANKEKATAKLAAALAAAGRADMLDAILAAPDFEAARAMIAAPAEPKADDALAAILANGKAKTEAAAKAAAQPKPKRAPKAPAKPKAERETLNGAALPRAGSKARITLDMMRAPGGTTAKETLEGGGVKESLADLHRDWAEKYGLIAEAGMEGRTKRYFLREQEAALAA